MTDPEEHSPKLGLTSPAALSGFGVFGLVVGWSLRRLFVVPPVSWLQMVTLLAVGLLLMLSARAMRRAKTDPARRLSPHQAVNRLAMAKAAALGGAGVAGAYFGHVLSWLPLGSEVAPERMLRAGIAGLVALFVMLSGLVLERACRIDDEDS